MTRVVGFGMTCVVGFWGDTCGVVWDDGSESSG